MIRAKVIPRLMAEPHARGAHVLRQAPAHPAWGSGASKARTSAIARCSLPKECTPAQRAGCCGLSRMMTADAITLLGTTMSSAVRVSSNVYPSVTEVMVPVTTPFGVATSN